MKIALIILCVMMCATIMPLSGQIIADHTIVDRYADIPQQFIDSVKTMWLVIAGESHSAAYRDGLNRLETLFPKYAVNVVESGTPDNYTDQNLRASRGTWGDLSNETGWIYSYGEEDWFTSETAINRTKAGISYCNSHNLTIGAIGLGWCWDPNIDDQSEFNAYINATRSYIDYCADSINTKIIFTSGTVDDYTGETGYLKYLGYETIRDSVSNHQNWILFDYADILCYDDDGGDSIITWNGHPYPVIASKNLLGSGTGHIGMNGALRLGKAMWWMLARIKGWDGTTADVPPGRKIPAKYSLNQNYPNPFNPTTVITYQIPSESQVTLKVFNILGKEVATLVNEVQQPGNKMVKFDAAAFSNGVYFYRLEACQLSGGKSGPFTQTRKLVLLK